MLHHPEGKLQSEEGSLANNWMAWNKYLHSIMEIICLEANYLQKIRKHSEQSTKHCDVFFRLAASVCFQNFNMSAISGEEDAANSSKRQRVSLNNYKCFSDLIQEFQHNCVPWLGILYWYVQNYCSNVTTPELMALLNVAETLMANNSSNFKWDTFELITCCVLNCIMKRPDCDHEQLKNILVTLWNSCVRNSSSTNDAHKPIHKIMQYLLKSDLLHYQTVQPLIKLYFEKGMPVTDSSINTLCCIYHKYYSKCSYPQERKKCFEWFTQGNANSVDLKTAKELFLRLLAKNNFSLKDGKTKSSKEDVLYEKLFTSMEKSILFSAGTINIANENALEYNINEPSEIDIEMSSIMQKFLHQKLTDHIDKLNLGQIPLLECLQYVKVVVTYIDIVLRISSLTRAQMEESPLYCSLKRGLNIMCRALSSTLKDTKDVRDRVILLQCMQSLWLSDYHPMIEALIRHCADQEFFARINEMLNIQVSKEDEAVYEENDAEYNPNALRHNSIMLLATYCRRISEFREDILELILDPDLYDFTTVWDVKCAFQCVTILIDRSMTESPLESIFALMRSMCQALFRNSEATKTILEVLLDILDRVWAHDATMRQNCLIMVKSYLQRCEMLYYPPHVAALVYKCVAKIAELNLNNSAMDCPFKNVLVEKTSENTHSLRLYTTYLLNGVIHHLSDDEVEAYMTGLLEIFTVNVSCTNEYILKDETSNRTLTILHRFLALAQTKKSLVHKILTRLLQIQNEKSLDVIVVKKFLNKITETTVAIDIETYLQNNILFVIHFWTSRNYKFEDLPLCIFGFVNRDAFLEKHMKWLFSADVLWINKGNVRKSAVLNTVKRKTGKSEESIVELCFSNIVSLCLPYVVTEKYNLSFMGAEEYNDFRLSMKNAIKMFQMTREILDNDKWSILFVENMAELLLTAAMHLRDQQGAKEMFQVNAPRMTESYLYPKTVFCSILKYYGELIDGNIMQYLCSDQATTLFHILYKLWDNVLQEKIFEYRSLSLYTFISFVECIPLGYDSDAFVCNFTCNSLTHAIKISKNRDEVRIFVVALKAMLTRFLPQAMALIRKSVLKARSVLLIKKEEGYENECRALSTYLAADLKEHLKQNEDVVDFSNASHETIISCATVVEFCERLKVYQFNLSCPSHEALIHLRQFVKLNKHHVNSLCEALNTKRFSEECRTSVIHQVIYALSNTMKSSSDDKIIIEACNCLSEIGTYDLKTIVTVPPPDTKRVTHLSPKQCFAFTAVDVLSEVLSDENPAATNKAVLALSDIFRYREGKEALELDDVNVQLLKPFLSTNSNDNAQFQLSSRELEKCCQSNLWVPLEKEDHNGWLIRVTTALLDILAADTNYLKSLRNVCTMKPTVSRQILPGLVGLLLECSAEMHIKVFSEQINGFFKHIWRMNFGDHFDSSGSDLYHKGNVINHDHKMIIQYALDVVNFVRLQISHYKTRPERTTLDALNYLRLDYDKVAWAASVARQNLVAIYYGELWAVAHNGGVPPSTPETTTKLNGGDNVQRMFRKCFVSIGEMDAIDGCGTAHLTSEDEKRKHLFNTGQYSDALLSHDIALSGPTETGSYSDVDLQFGVVRSLHKSGMHHLALQYIKSLPESEQLNDVKYDCLTCLGDWSNFVDTQDLEEKSKNTMLRPLSIIKAFRYACLKDCLNLQTGKDFESKLTLPLNRAKLTISRWCQKLNMENCQSVYKVVANLHLFNDIEDYYSVKCGKLPFETLLSNWKTENLALFHDFKHLEPLISQRSLILEYAGKTYKNFLKDIIPLQLQYAELSLSNERVQMAQRLLATAKKMQNSDAVALVEGQVCWAKGHKEIALSLVRNVMGSDTANMHLTAASLRQYGMWMAESKFDNARDIINKYLMKSLHVLDKCDHVRTRLKVYHDIAKFADSEYKQVVSYMNSSIFENKLKCLESMKGTADSMKSTQSSLLTKDEKKVLFTTQKLSTLDEADIANTKAEKLRFLQLAMKYYLLSLKHCEDNNLSVFRVISLWLDNPALQLEGESFEQLLLAIPSRKFLTVLPQLAPRITQDTTPFAQNLTAVLKRCAREHPHHTLPILFSLKNSDKDMYILNASRGAGGAARALEPRDAAAAALVADLAESSAVLAKIIGQMERLCDATISFANFKTQAKEQRQKIPSAELIHKLGHLDAIPVPIDTIAVRNDCNYSYIPTLVAFDNYFELVGGINCPKKINCRSSDGKKRIVLVKGEDDLRQDAVMQQVFHIVNTLLEKNPVTSRNKLLIRTYKVVPMSRQSGVLEWCEGTQPIGSYLIGSNGAHARYRPKDISCTAARSKFTTIQASRRTLAEKLAIYLGILKNFKPVFHHFFTEHYLDPVTWYERRLAYTKSVATSSMVGYILGLGDRHVQNILIDKNTAEVVHIDFGIAFDQGKALPTPETIPFRLTQDIIAGFGSSGVEGIFRKSCEKTMQLLRDNHETLLTILEVLLCDPFYSWTTKKITATPKDSNLNLPAQTGSVADLAERTLLAVSSKLSGTEGGAAGGVAVPGQVAQLISTATDPANLCRLYHGWQPYL
ncbi:serine-protein kinase ATM-like isoform X3 [Choristoneura fumiferana]